MLMNIVKESIVIETDILTLMAPKDKLLLMLNNSPRTPEYVYAKKRGSFLLNYYFPICYGLIDEFLSFLETYFYEENFYLIYNLGVTVEMDNEKQPMLRHSHVFTLSTHLMKQ